MLPQNDLLLLIMLVNVVVTGALASDLLDRMQEYFSNFHVK